MELFDYSKSKNKSSEDVLSLQLRFKTELLAFLCTYVVSEGTAVLGLDAIEALQINIKGVECLALSSSTPTLPAELRSERV